MNELHLFAGGTMKKCTKCKQIKPRSEYYKNRTQPDGLANQCSACAKAVQNEIYARNPDKYRAKALEYRTKHGPRTNQLRRLNRREIYIAESARRYSTTTAEIKRLIEIKHCEICNRGIDFKASNVHHRPNIDHCHKTLKVRGVLCGYCNNMLGRANDNPELLLKAATYLNERQ